MSRPKIAVVEDEPDIREVLEHHLEREGFAVVTAASGHAGLELVARETPNLVVLDLLLPGVDGVEVCRRLKMDPATRDVPVIMVTAKGEEADVVLGLGVGADDYVVKPFRPKELLARVRAVLRRGAPAEAPAGERVERDGLTIDAGRHEAEVEGRPLVLTATEFRLLHLLASNPGRVFTRDQLISKVIGGGAAVIDRNIDVHVRSIRKKLGAKRHLIGTIRGVGYRFEDQGSE